MSGNWDWNRSARRSKEARRLEKLKLGQPKRKLPSLKGFKKDVP